MAIDRSKLRRERMRHREEVRKEEQKLFGQVDGFYIDGKRDATLLLKEVDGKYSRKVEFEEHIVMVGQPGEFYLSHTSPDSGTGLSIATSIFNEIKDTNLAGKLNIIGSDGTAAMTGAYNGAIRKLKELMHKPLQWVICLLHCVKLPLRHVFIDIDGTTTSPDKFSGPIGSNIAGCVSDWEVNDFRPIRKPTFPYLPNHLVNDFSSDQYYAYRICWCVILGEIDENILS